MLLQPHPALCHAGIVPLPSRRHLSDDRFVFRPTTGLAACALWAVVGAAWLVLAALSGWSELARQAPAVIGLSAAVYAVCWRPRVIVGTDEVQLRNVVRDVTIPYTAISGIDTQYTLTIATTDGRRHQAWAAPAGGRFGAARVTDEERKSLSWSGPVEEIPSSAGLRSDAGAAAVAVRRRWQAVLEQDGGAMAGTVTVRWATGVLVAAGLSLTAVVVAALL